jgi:hypothetical protein
MTWIYMHMRCNDLWEAKDNMVQGHCASNQRFGIKLHKQLHRVKVCKQLVSHTSVHSILNQIITWEGNQH